MVQANSMKPMGSPTASPRTRELVLDEDWLCGTETGAWFEMVDGPDVRVELEGATGTSLRKILLNEHRSV